MTIPLFMEGNLPFSLINPFARCSRFPKMWSNNPFGAPRRAFGSPTPSHDHIFAFTNATVILFGGFYLCRYIQQPSDEAFAGRALAGARLLVDNYNIALTSFFFGQARPLVFL